METPSLYASYVSAAISSGVIGTCLFWFFEGIMPVGASVIISFPASSYSQSFGRDIYSHTTLYAVFSLYGSCGFGNECLQIRYRILICLLYRTIFSKSWLKMNSL